MDYWFTFEESVKGLQNSLGTDQWTEQCQVAFVQVKKSLFVNIYLLNFVFQHFKHLEYMAVRKH